MLLQVQKLIAVVCWGLNGHRENISAQNFLLDLGPALTGIFQKSILFQSIIIIKLRLPSNVSISREERRE